LLAKDIPFVLEQFKAMDEETRNKSIWEFAKDRKNHYVDKLRIAAVLAVIWGLGDCLLGFVQYSK
jgi:hypothetical protein